MRYFGGGKVRIYIDLVAALNCAVDFLLILGTNRLAGFPPGCARAAWAAVLGGIYGGMCLIPEFAFLGYPQWRAVSLCLISLVAFGCNRSALHRGGIFVLLSMALGGIAVGIGHDGLTALMFSAFLMLLLCCFSFRGHVGRREYIPVTLWWRDREINIIALKDTGNTLHDPVTGEQVLVAGADVCAKLLGLTEHQIKHPVETLASGAIPGLRLIPYHTVGQPGSMLLAVRILKARVGNRVMQPLVAFAPEEIAHGEMYQMLAGGTV